MADRLSALDASFLYLEDRSVPLHVGSVAVLRRPRTGFDYGQLVALIERLLPEVPRYRQKVVPVPAHLARPVWVDDPDFDLTYHVRRSALPRPGTEAQLLELVARLMSRPLDHDRPLWEAYLIEGLAKSHLALVTKTHLALADDLGRLILDGTPAIPKPAGEGWRARAAPGRTRLIRDAVADTARHPGELIENARFTVEGLISAVGGVVRRPAPTGPLTVPIGSQRRFAVARARLEDLRGLRAEHDATEADVVLAVLTGALRGWLLSRGDPVTSESTVRALVPVGTEGKLVELPVGEPNPVVRLQHISHAMRPQPDPAGSVVAAARNAAGAAKRVFHLMVANVPGPRGPVYAGTAQLTELFPAMPLLRDQALAVGVTSYDGGVYFGLTGDRDALSDVDLLAKMVEESVDELLTIPRRS